jgi:hypothetical protein
LYAFNKFKIISPLPAASKTRPGAPVGGQVGGDSGGAAEGEAEGEFEAGEPGGEGEGEGVEVEVVDGCEGGEVEADTSFGGGGGQDFLRT